MAEYNKDFSFFRNAWSRYRSDPLAMVGLYGVILLIGVAVMAPLLSNSRPLLLYRDGQLTFPFWRYIFAPDSIESLVEKVFNYFLLFLPCAGIIWFFLRRHAKKMLFICIGTMAILLTIPFFLASPHVDKNDWRADTAMLKGNNMVIFAPVKFGPFELVGLPYEKPSRRYWLGTDQIGRDVLARMIYGSRVSLAVGVFATAIAMIIGTIVGICSGYYRGKLDLILMRIVEIIICFPTFLLLLILMSMLIGRKFEQSTLIVIAVIGFTGWIGLCGLVRGETLKNRILPYIQSCEATGLPVWRIMLFHLLPNISGPILISFSFGVAGAILAESGLSFLGFGVQAPTASWGGLLRQAFDDPFAYWHLTLCPGLALFIAVCSFNFTGEGLRKILDPR
jgi:peptide/nickel transport system permease protein